MSVVSSQNERKQLEEDIERIKSTLQEEDDEEDDEDGEYCAIDETLTLAPHLSTLPPQYPINNEWDVASEASTSRATTSKNKTEGLPGKGSLKSQAQQQHEAVSTDENFALPQMCLALNKAYQEIIMENLENIQLMLARNKTKQEEVQAALTDEMAYRGLRNHTGQSRKQPFSYYGFPFFRDKSGFPPPLNEDTKARQTNHEISGYTRIPRFWKNKEKATLKRAIQEDKLKQKLRPLLTRKEVELEKLDNAKTPEAVAQAEGRIKSLGEQITLIRNNVASLPMSEEEQNNIDWMKISIVDLDGMRDPEDIRLFWNNAMQPSINTSRWRMGEDMKLARIVEETGGRNWAAIAKTLDTNRTSFQCLQRFQTKLNPCLVTGKWTEEEDAFLKEVVESVSVNEQTPWDQVAYYMEGRSDEQCEKRWKGREDIKMGKWSTAEDQVLLDAVKRCGLVWVKVASLVPNRSAAQCRERYKNALNMMKRTGTYSYSEDKILWQLVPESGVAPWAKIASCIPGRSDNSCLQRYKILKQLEVLERILRAPPYGPEVVDKLVKLRAHQLTKSQQATEEDAAIKHLEKHILSCGRRIEKLEMAVALELKSENEPRKSVLRSLECQNAKDQQMRKKLEKLQEAKKSRQPDTKDVLLMLSDRKNGVIVPIPLLGDRTLGKVLFPSQDVKESLDQIMHRIDTRMRHIDQQTWRDIALSSDKALKELLLDKHIQTVPAIPPRRWVKKPRPSKSKKNRIKTEPSAKIDVSPAAPMQTSPKPAPRVKAKERRINEQICDLLRKTQPQTPPLGRPKIFYAPEATESGMGSVQDIEGKVIKLFAKALNMDVDGTKTCSQKLLQKHSIDFTQPMDADLSSDAEQFKLEKNLRQLKGSLWKDVELEPTEAPNKSSDVIQRMLPRYAMTGPEAIKAYNLPPLPPSVCTLRAFKTLLIDRKNLVRRTKARVPRKKAATKRKASEVTSPAKDGSGKKSKTDETIATPDAQVNNNNLNEENASESVRLPVEETVHTVGSSVNSFGTLPGDTGVAERQNATEIVATPNLETQPSTSSIDTLPLQAPGPFTPHIRSGASSVPNHDNVPRQTAHANQTNKHGTVVVLKGSELTTEAIASALRAQGIVTDAQKLRMKILSKRDLAVNVQSKPTSGKSGGKNPGNAKSTIKSLRQMHDYQLLKARFKSMFLWPAFLSTVRVQAKRQGSGGLQERGEATGSQTPREGPGDPDSSDCDVKPLINPTIMGAQRLETKKTKKLKTVRNRYPCQYGKRSRKMTVMRREQKLIAVQKFKENRAHLLQSLLQKDNSQDINLPKTSEVVKVVTKSELEDNTDSQDSAVPQPMYNTSLIHVPDASPDDCHIVDTALEHETVSIQDSNDGCDTMPLTAESELHHTNENPNANSGIFHNISPKQDLELCFDTRTTLDVDQTPSQSSIVASFSTPLPVQSTSSHNFQTPRPSQKATVCKFFTPRQSSVCNFLQHRPKKSPGICKFLGFGPKKTPKVRNSPSVVPNCTPSLQVSSSNPSSFAPLNSSNLGPSQMPYIPISTVPGPTVSSVFHSFPTPISSQLHATGVFPVSGPTASSAFQAFPNFVPGQFEATQAFPMSLSMPFSHGLEAMDSNEQKPFEMQMVHTIDCPEATGYPHSSTGEMVVSSGTSSPAMDLREASAMDTQEVMYVIVKNEVESEQKDMRDRSTAINGKFSNYSRVNPSDLKKN